MVFVPIPLAPVNSDSETDGKSSSNDESSDKEEENVTKKVVKAKEDSDWREKAKWLSGSWKLEPFNEKRSPSERKAEWRKFRDQFERIADCKMPVDPATKLKGMKIHAGEFLLGIIGMQEKMIAEKVDNIYDAVVERVNGYFDATCDKTQERMNFRGMKQKSDEPFTDWVLRLEEKLKYCDFGAEQRSDEFVQALLTNSLPQLAEKLYEASNLLNQDLNKIIQHGQFLDVARVKQEEKTAEEKKNSEEQSAADTKPIMMLRNEGVRKFGRESRIGRFTPYGGSRYDSGSQSSGYQRDWKSLNRRQVSCSRCGRFHEANRCPAAFKQCNKCKKVGHFAVMCRGDPKVKGDVSYQTDNVKAEAFRTNQVQTEEWSE